MGIFYSLRSSSVACDGDLKKVQKFLNQGVHPNVCDAAGYTALHYASLKGYINVSQSLLEAGANINAVTRAGRATPLHRAATSGLFLRFYSQNHSVSG